MIDLIIFTLFASVAGFVWTLITEPDEILDFIPSACYQLTKWKWLLKMMQCAKCMAGEIALWGYLIVYFNAYNPFEHLAVIAFAIFGGYVLDKYL